MLACPSPGPPALLGLFRKASASSLLRLGGVPFEGVVILPPPGGADPPLLAFPLAGKVPRRGERGVGRCLGGTEGGRENMQTKKGTLRPNFHIMYETVSHLRNFLPI